MSHLMAPVQFCLLLCCIRFAGDGGKGKGKAPAVRGGHDETGGDQAPDHRGGASSDYGIGVVLLWRATGRL